MSSQRRLSPPGIPETCSQSSISCLNSAVCLPPCPRRVASLSRKTSLRRVAFLDRKTSLHRIAFPGMATSPSKTSCPSMAYHLSKIVSLCMATFLSRIAYLNSPPNHLGKISSLCKATSLNKVVCMASSLSNLDCPLSILSSLSKTTSLDMATSHCYTLVSTHHCLICHHTLSRSSLASCSLSKPVSRFFWAAFTPRPLLQLLPPHSSLGRSASNWA